VILPEDVFALIARVHKIKHSLYKEPQSDLAHKKLNEVLFALEELKAKL
jgi:hypothetical protein